jgi:2-methylfumaryl-CoA hydratase
VATITTFIIVFHTFERHVSSPQFEPRTGSLDISFRNSLELNSGAVRQSSHTMNKGTVQNFFEDFHVGQTFECPTPRVLTNADRVAYIALTGDRTPRFCDTHNRIHPLIVFHTVLSQTVRPISLNAVANLGYAEMMWKQAVHIGDTIRTTATIVGLKENSSQRDGIVYVKTTGRNQWNEVVLEYTRWVMVRKNRESATPYLRAPVIPHVQPVVAPERLTLHSPDQCYHAVTGGSFFFEDYRIGERIVHHGSLPVSESDHMTFTRLYQNSARLHFEAIKPHPVPVVFGGYTISLGYALALSGLENRLGLVAVNKGAHPNPVYAGDRLSCYTEVLDTIDANPVVGLLRLRMVVLKNLPAQAIAPEEVLTPETPVHEHSVVVDLDYWEPVLKRP